MLATVETYLARLPAGLDSYAEAAVKGSIVREWVAATDLRARLEEGQVPREVETLLREPPPASSWVREVEYVALVVATYELCWKGAGGVAAFERWRLDVSRKMLSGPLYRVLFLVASPERVFVGAERRWGAFHRGSALRVRGRESRRAELELTFPPRVFPELALRLNGRALQAAAEAAGLKRVEVALSDATDVSGHFEISWA